MRRAAALLVAAALAAAGCGGDEEEPAPRADTGPRTATQDAGERSRPQPARLVPARCPRGLANCASATGRVVYVEKVDPDGDGDAHFVLVGGSVTGPGLSVIDVRRDLRPDPLPGIGDLVTASGPVYRGSHGQRQIEAREVRTRRLR